VLKEHEVVALTRALPEHRLEAGDVGAIIAIHAGGSGYTVEFVTYAGETVAIADVREGDIRLIQEGEIANVRQVA
jgi:hypothetical protein